jgi:tetratricopeptide (TPR) repeat protein
MTTRLRIVLLAALFTASSLFAQAPSPPASQQEDEAQYKLLELGGTLLRAKRPADAISVSFDKVIAFYEAKYRDRPEQVYCATSGIETLAYLTRHATEKPQTNAIVVRGWCDALYLKAYALVELQRLAEAKSALESAIALAPQNSLYLSELGHVYERERDWSKAMQYYKAAEEGAQLAEPPSKARLLARAMRGVGYVLIELGDLDQAERKFTDSLEVEKDNPVAKNELGYIKQLREKQGAK